MRVILRSGATKNLKERSFATLRMTALLFCLFTATGADYLGGKIAERSRNLMGDSFQITIFEASISGAVLEKAIDAAFDKIKSLDEALADVHRATAGQEIDLNSDALAALKISRRVSSLSKGGFDGTAYPITKLWDDAKKRAELPDKAQIENALPLVGDAYILLDSAKKKLKLQKSGVQIDLGGVGKGYALEQAATMLREAGVTSGVISAGDDLRLIGEARESKAWRVGIEHPRAIDAYAAALELPADFAVTTIGDTDDFFLYKGKRYGHIFDPRTGFPPENEIVSVTIVARDAALAQGLGAAFFVMGADKGYELIEEIQLEGIEAVCIEEGADGKLRISSSEGLHPFLKDINL